MQQKIEFHFLEFLFFCKAAEFFPGGVKHAVLTKNETENRNISTLSAFFGIIFVSGFQQKE